MNESVLQDKCCYAYKAKVKINGKMNYREMWTRLSPLYGDAEAKAIVSYVLDVRYGMTMSDILCGGVDSLPQEQQVDLQTIMDRLLCAEPVQYVLGRAEFGGRWFHVAPGVLIPRPETEQLCQWITEDWNGISSPKLLDVGTGSGCIAITLALDLPQAEVSAIDISQQALDIAQANARRLLANVAFRQDDALALKPQSDQWQIVVSNPPYICNKEKVAMNDNVLRYEPHIALFVPDDDPLRFYRAIARYASASLVSGGALYYEINPVYAEQMGELLKEMGFTKVVVKQDMFGKQRMMKAVIEK